MTVELYDVARALRRHGMTVQNKSGSFITVVFPVPDGSKASIDVYTCFYVGDLLYETATVRAVVPRWAIEPLTELEFEGRMLPAPADPAGMLEVSYGPGWRVPDPSFRHEPGPEITDRFDGWFGSLMRNRRDWERYLTDLDKDPDARPVRLRRLGGRPPRRPAPGHRGRQRHRPRRGRTSPGAASRSAASTTPAPACGRPQGGERRGRRR